MAGAFGMLLPSAEERGLNDRLLAENLDHLVADPEWSPASLSRLPRCLVRLHNRLVPRLPLTGPLGWLDGKTWADDLERERVDSLPEEDRSAARLLHDRAVHFRCVRGTPVPMGKPPG